MQQDVESVKPLFGDAISIDPAILAAKIGPAVLARKEQPTVNYVSEERRALPSPPEEHARPQRP